MRRFGRTLAVLLGVVLLPIAAFAQASLSGIARDTSGAVLPGVTVEAASPVLIEKVRTAVTDGSGRYQIENLRPGQYVITFTLAGFNTLVRGQKLPIFSGLLMTMRPIRAGLCQKSGWVITTSLIGHKV